MPKCFQGIRILFAVITYAPGIVSSSPITKLSKARTARCRQQCTSKKPKYSVCDCMEPKGSKFGWAAGIPEEKQGGFHVTSYSHPLLPCLLSWPCLHQSSSRSSMDSRCWQVCHIQVCILHTSPLVPMLPAPVAEIFIGKCLAWFLHVAYGD